MKRASEPGEADLTRRSVVVVSQVETFKKTELEKYIGTLSKDRLIEEVKTNNRSLTVYALSDEDRYYEKKGYKKIGSVFEI